MRAVADVERVELPQELIAVFDQAMQNQTQRAQASDIFVSMEMIQEGSSGLDVDDVLNDSVRRRISVQNHRRQIVVGTAVGGFGKAVWKQYFAGGIDEPPFAAFLCPETSFAVKKTVVGRAVSHCDEIFIFKRQDFLTTIVN